MKCTLTCPVGGAIDCIVCEGRTQQIAADTLEALAIAAIYSDGGVQLHAEGRDEHGCGARRLRGHGPQRWPGKTELNARGQAFVGWFAVVLEVLGKIAMQPAEHAHEGGDS